jgi:hypothetical protein
MSIVVGSVLAQPQKVRRAAAQNADAALLHDLFDLSGRILVDLQQGGRMVEVLTEALLATGAAIINRVTTGSAQAQQRLKDWLTPAVQFGVSFGASLPGADGSEDGLDPARQLLLKLSELAANLTLDRLRANLQVPVDILQTDLGVTPAFLQEMVWTLIDECVSRLETMPSNTPVKERENRFGAAACLRRIKVQFFDQFTFPELDVEILARLVLDLLRSNDFDKVVQRAACVARHGADAIGNVQKVINLSPSGSTPAPPGLMRSEALVASPVSAAPETQAGVNAGTYAWYPSWLLQYKTFYELGRSELSNTEKLASFLKTSTVPVARFLRQQFAPETRQQLDSWQGSGNPPETLVTTILDELNKLMVGHSIYDEQIFEGVKVREDTLKLERELPRGEDRVKLNRMLLEDIFPEAIDALPRNCFPKLWAGFRDFALENIGWPADPVRIDAEGKRVMVGDKPIYKGDNADWKQARIFAEDTDSERFYMFKHISADFLDKFAWISSISVDGIRTIWHLTNIQPSHQIGPVLNSVYDVTHGAIKTGLRKPYSGFDFFSHKWLEWPLGAQLTLTTAGSFQGIHTKASAGNIFAFWFTLVAGDIINWASPMLLTGSIRDFFLSMFTLINFGGPRDGPSTLPEKPAENHNEIAGVSGLIVSLFTMWLASFVERKDYVNPTKAPGNVIAIWLLGGIGMGFAGGLLGAFVAQVFAWAEDFGQFFLTGLKAIPRVVLSFWFVLYGVREGDTDDGKFNAAGAPFAGYPLKVQEDDAETETPSPYFLPYAKDVTYVCGQGNAGMWSHNALFSGTVQTYAYDFGFDQADEILAARPGTVVSFQEATADDTTGTWNNIIIRHDIDDDGNPIAPDPFHDRDINGRVSVTFAVYGHGRQNGVTNAFALWDAPPATIRGARVRRGQPIMLAGDTGTSFHNHLHIHVTPETPPPGATGPSSPASSATQNSSYTIPFVFQDVDGDGVCQHLKWYTSSNERRTA